MIVDGAKIAQAIEEEDMMAIQSLERHPRLRVFTCQPTFATKRFLALKRAHAEKIGVELVVEECTPEITTDVIVEMVRKAVDEADGVIVQLPFPPNIDIARILMTIPASHDVDAIGFEAEGLFAGGTALVLPPVVGAISEIIAQYNAEIKGKKAVVVGEGRLVGAPVAVWLTQQGADVQTINKSTKDIGGYTREADILVLGAGVPGLVTPDMIRDGVVIFDAGSSEDTGKLVGDADQACAEKASIFTPVPGGIGPITISLIFRNLLTLIEHRGKEAV